MLKVKLDDYIIDNLLNELPEDALGFLELGGRKAFHSQGFYGQGMVCAVIDTGVNSEHPELKGKVLAGKSFVDYTTSTMDDGGHGTHVAGTIVGTNCGSAPKGEILPVKVLAGDGDGNLKDIIDACNWVDTWRHPKTGKRVDIVSMSLSAPASGWSNDLALFEAAINKLSEHGTIVFCSAGNTGTYEVRYPAGFDAVIAVGAVDFNKNIAMFSTKGEHVDICQVGVNVISAWYKGGYAEMSGTSMSTPMSSGIAMLLGCKYKQMFNATMSQVLFYETIKFNTKDLGIQGIDKIYGAGFFTLQPLELDIWLRDQSNIMTVNGKNITMDVPAKIEQGRFDIPFRYIGEVTGAKILWKPEIQSGNLRY